MLSFCQILSFMVFKLLTLFILFVTTGFNITMPRSNICFLIASATCFYVRVTEGWSTTATMVSLRAKMITVRFLSDQPTIENYSGDEAIAPNLMRVSEIKGELEWRGVDYSTCIDKESLVATLEEARASGRANPDILNQFNKQKLEETFSPEKRVKIDDDDIDQVLANDGSLPGGMKPETLKKMMGNPEVMSMLQNVKMQEAMKLIMLGGQEDLEKALAEDPEMRDVVGQLNELLRGSLT